MVDKNEGESNKSNELVRGGKIVRVWTVTKPFAYQDITHVLKGSQDNEPGNSLEHQSEQMFKQFILAI